MTIAVCGDTNRGDENSAMQDIIGTTTKSLSGISEEALLYFYISPP